MFRFHEDHEGPRVCSVQIMGVEIMSYQDQSLVYGRSVLVLQALCACVGGSGYLFRFTADPYCCNFTGVLDCNKLHLVASKQARIPDDVMVLF